MTGGACRAASESRSCAGHEATFQWGARADATRRSDASIEHCVRELPRSEVVLPRSPAAAERGAAEFVRLVSAAACRSLAEIFGEDLAPQGLTAAVDRGGGKASLGCLLPSSRLRLMLEYGKVKVLLADDSLQLVASVTDLQLCGEDHSTPDPAALDRMNADLERLPVCISVGLFRPFLRPGDTVERHWLQANTILFDRTGLR